MWRKLLFRERRMWRVLRIIILPIFKNGELCHGELYNGEFCYGEFCEFSELCHGEFCEFSECCETYVSYVLMSKKNSDRRENELMSKNSGRRGLMFLMFLCLKKTAGGESMNLCLKKQRKARKKMDLCSYV